MEDLEEAPSPVWCSNDAEDEDSAKSGAIDEPPILRDEHAIAELEGMWEVAGVINREVQPDGGTFEATNVWP